MPRAIFFQSGTIFVASGCSEIRSTSRPYWSMVRQCIENSASDGYTIRRELKIPNDPMPSPAKYQGRKRWSDGGNRGLAEYKKNAAARTVPIANSASRLRIPGQRQ